jgi:hypothetical protein
MSRTFWIVVGAVGGVAAYRKGTRAAVRAKELGPMGSAQVAATATSKLAGRTASGLGRLQDLKDRREGRMVTGRVEEVGVEAPPVGWLRAPSPGSPTAPAGGPQDTQRAARGPSTASRGGVR